MSDDIPTTWETVSLRELGEWRGGGTPSKAVPAYWDGSIPWVSPKDMKTDSIVDAEDHITEDAIEQSATSLVPSEAVLMVTRSGILAHSFPVAVAKTAVALNQDLKALIPHEGIDSEFVAWALRRYSQDILAGCSKHGTTVHSIETPRLQQFEIPLAPTNEQRRIVEKIDELFSQIEAGEQALARAQKLLGRYRQSVLNAAVTGELTRDWRDQHKGELESGEALLRRILDARRAAWEQAELAKMHARGKPPADDRWKQKYKEPAQPDAAALPALPEDWVWSSLGQLFEVSVGATPSRAQPSYWNGNIPWVSSGEVRFTRIHATREQITEEGMQSSSTNLHPRGTVLLAMIGEGRTRGQAAILDVESCHNQNAASIRVSETPIPSEYVFYFLMWRYQQTRKMSSGGNQPALNSERVRSIRISLPGLDELQIIVSLLEERFSILEAAQRALAEEGTRSDSLQQAILRAAFSGKLVPQDPADEPASVLLERLREERAAAAPDGVPKRRRRGSKAGDRQAGGQLELLG